MPTKIRRKRETQKGKGLKVNTEAVRILRTVSDEEAFYFYEDIGKPTGESAKSLPDFLEKIKSVKLESLRFHLQRKDFQNWIEKILGDSKLARRIEKIVPSSEGDVRAKIYATIENRFKELGYTSVTLLVNPDLAVAVSSSTS
jgi:hypothetical protein